MTDDKKILTIRCSNCDGAVPLTNNDYVRCPYCLSLEAVSDEIAARVDKNDAALRAVDDQIEKVRQDAQSADKIRILIGVVGALVGLSYMGGVFYFSIFGNAQSAAAGINPGAIVIMAAIALILPAVPVVSVIVYYRKRVQQLALLPMAQLDFEGEPSIRCPSCDGDIHASNSVKITCPFCLADCLAPAVMINGAKQRFLEKVMAAKREDAVSSDFDLEEIVNKVIGAGLILLGIAMWLGIGLFILSTGKGEPIPPEDVTRVYLISFGVGLPGLLIFSILGIKKLRE